MPLEFDNVAELLIEKGADVNHVGHEGNDNSRIYNTLVFGSYFQTFFDFIILIL